MFWNKNLRIGVWRDARLIGSVCVAVWIAFFAYVSRLNSVSHDVFHEMALAREYFQTGVFPISDVFAFTPTTSPTVHHEWATGVVLYWIAGASPLGLQGLPIAWVLLIALLGLLTYRAARNNGAHPLLIGVCGLIAFPVLWVGFSMIRAQLFTLIFLVFQILLQQSDWRGKRSWVMAWLLMYVVWLNMHAGFVVGVGLLGFHMLERWGSALLRSDLRTWLRNFLTNFWHHVLLILAIPFGLLINPWGIDYPTYLYHAIRMKRPSMQEWGPLWTTYQPVLTMLAFGTMCAGLIYVLQHRQLLRLRGWLFTCLAAYMALKHIRHGSLFAIVWIVFLPGWISPTPIGHAIVDWMQRRRTAVVIAAWTLSLACLLFSFQHKAWQFVLPHQDPHAAMLYPVGAVEYLKRERFRGNIMTPFIAGSYVTWECYPNALVSLDGRYEVAYREDVLPKHDRFYFAQEGWREVLDEYAADAVLVRQIAPVRKLMGSPEHGTGHYRLVYEDTGYALFYYDELSVGASLRSGAASLSLLEVSGVSR